MQKVNPSECILIGTRLFNVEFLRSNFLSFMNGKCNICINLIYFFLLHAHATLLNKYGAGKEVAVAI